MREVGDLVLAFLVLLSGVVVAPIAALVVVRMSASVGVNPAALLLLTTFGFLALMAAGWNLIQRAEKVRA